MSLWELQSATAAHLCVCWRNCKNKYTAKNSFDASFVANGFSSETSALIYIIHIQSFVLMLARSGQVFVYRCICSTFILTSSSVVHWVFHRVGGACCRYFPSRFNDVAPLFIFHECISKRPLKRFVESLYRWRSIRFTAQLIFFWKFIFNSRPHPEMVFSFYTFFRLFLPSARDILENVLVSEMGVVSVDCDY